MSASSTAIGSVGTSAVPIFATTCLISGKRSLSTLSASKETFMLLLKELPGGSVICIAKSPSSNVGINSAPNLPKSKSDATSIEKAIAVVFQIFARERFRSRLYPFPTKSKNLSANLLLSAISLLRKSDAIIGT